MLCNSSITKKQKLDGVFAHALSSIRRSDKTAFDRQANVFLMSAVVLLRRGFDLTVSDVACV